MLSMRNLTLNTFTSCFQKGDKMVFLFFSLLLFFFDLGGQILMQGMKKVRERLVGVLMEAAFFANHFVYLFALLH